jgi:hypothetical protein
MAWRLSRLRLLLIGVRSWSGSSARGPDAVGFHGCGLGSQKGAGHLRAFANLAEDGLRHSIRENFWRRVRRAADCRAFALLHSRCARLQLPGCEARRRHAEGRFDPVLRVRIATRIASWRAFIVSIAPEAGGLGKRRICPPKAFAVSQVSQWITCPARRSGLSACQGTPICSYQYH